MKRAEEKVVDSQEKLEYGKKDEVEKHWRVFQGWKLKEEKEAMKSGYLFKGSGRELWEI